MNKSLEPVLYVAVLALLGGGVLAEGARQSELEEKLPISAKALYGMLAKSQVRYQLVDVRADPSENYEDAHVPGAVPFPGCEMNATPQSARAHILPSVPTIVISGEGDAATFGKCLAFFTTARNLQGGFTAWADENLPEDSGDYVPPKPGAGGGCL